MISIQNKLIVPESCHYYYQDGRPCLSVPNKGDGSHEPDIRDAKKLSLYPGVTGITRIEANRFIEEWGRVNAIEATIRTLEKNPNATFEDCNAESKKAREESATRGKYFHEQIDRFFLGEKIEDEIVIVACDNIIKFLDDRGLKKEDVQSECSFVNTYLGFGGRIDLKSVDGRLLLDWKTTEKPRKVAYDSEKMQGAAYLEGIESPLGTFYDIIVNAKDGSITPIELTEEDRFYAWKKFRLLYEVWCLNKKYDPRKLNEKASSV